MKIIKYKKMNSGKYKVFLDKSEIILYEDVIIKYKLLTLKEIDLQLMNKILKDNKYFEVLNIALKYLEIKMRNKKEMVAYLSKKEFDIELINKIIEKLTIDGYLNETSYIKAFINDKINFTNYGPERIKNELTKYELSNELIETELEKIEDLVWIEKINKIVNKKISLNNKLSQVVLKNKIKNDLYYLGYNNYIVDEILSTFSFNTDKALEREYQKAYNKYIKRLSGEKLYKEIKNYLYKKHFDIDSINKIIYEKTENL